MPARTRALTLLYAATLFVSAALLFWVEPLVAKLLLPLLGGTPAVWNTCLLFFQLTLLAGYAYALAASKWLTPRQQVGAQLCLLALAFLSLPIELSAATINSVPHTDNPAFWLLGRLLLTVGLPFFVLATSGPLLQKWFAATGTVRARDPYFLYAASNAGSLLALLAYPALLEPRFNLGRQSRLWLFGYGLLVVLVALCALTLWRARRKQAADSEPDEANADAAPARPTTAAAQLTRRRRLRWVALAFVPSSLMLGVTTYISTDIASLPLLWVIPLALYLLTLVLAFARRQLIAARLLVRLLPGVTLVLVLVYLSGATQPAAFLVLLHLIYFFVAAWTCHALLAADRPRPAHLAEFYFWLAVGGALGGLCNALLAPAIFNAVVEYPLVMLLACLLLPPADRRATARARRLDVVIPVAIGLLALAAALLADRLAFEHLETLAVAVGAPLVIAYLCRPRPLRFVLALGAIMLASSLFTRLGTQTLYAERNFFGVLRVTRDEGSELHWLYNGSTVHGRQYTDLLRQCEPLSYYHRQGPLGAVFAAYHDLRPAPNVAVVGLGTGATAAYARADEQWTFYEINPAVVGVARAPEYFTYLINCAHAPVKIILGDARLQLARAPANHYGLIVLDAFSSDAIPVHLMTRQALDLYLAKLAPTGLLAVHISNRSLDLHPVVADLARSRDLVCLVFDDTRPGGVAGKEAAQWVVMARHATDLGPLQADAHWLPLAGAPGRAVWTDDFSNILSVFKWH